LPRLAPLADDGFGQRLALDGDRLIVRVDVVDVEGGIGQRGDAGRRQRPLIELVGRQRPLFGCAGLGAFSSRAGR
jgi:hypothetical protein